MVELQILGHLILYVLCMIVFGIKYRKEHDIAPNDTAPIWFFNAVFLFIPLEIIYWICHSIFV